MFFLFFFFQAEDGIRDKLVTGVQTCALPILPAANSYIFQVSSQKSGQRSVGTCGERYSYRSARSSVSYRAWAGRTCPLSSATVTARMRILSLSGSVSVLAFAGTSKE